MLFLTHFAQIWSTELHICPSYYGNFSVDSLDSFKVNKLFMLPLSVSFW